MGGTEQRLTAELVEVLVDGMAELRHLHLHMLIDLERRFSHDQLTDALSHTVETFPVLGCRYIPGFWRDRWVEWKGDLGDLVRVLPGDEGDLADKTLSIINGELPHRRSPPHRLTLIEHGNGSRLMISVHHMVADGGGLKAFAHILGSRLKRTEPTIPASCERGLLTPLRALRLRDIPTLLFEMLRESLQPLSILRARKLIPGAQSEHEKDSPQWRSLVLDSERTHSFADRCKAQRATINDGFVAAMALMTGRLSTAGPVAAAYTIDLRRYLPSPKSLVTNLHGASLVVLGRDRIERPEVALDEVSRQIGEQKRRLPGLGYAMLPGLTLGWLPHGVLRWAGRSVLQNVLSYLDRSLAVTNIGALDETLEPFGHDAVAASILGPFIDGLPLPVVTATGFRQKLTLNVCGAGSIATEVIDEHTKALGAALDTLSS